MKRIITTVLVGIILAYPGGVKAQIDESKMEKDIRVASTVLASLSHSDTERLMYGGDNIDGNYIDGYGVIFSMRGSSFRRSSRVGYSYNVQGAVVVTTESDSKEDKSAEEERVALQEETKKLMIDFLADYSQMIGQLKPTDKIVVSTKKSDDMFVVVGTRGEMSRIESSGFSAELLKKDQNDYIQGKISRDKLIAKIVVTETNAETSRSKDLDLFSSMLRTVYDDQYTDTYFMSRKPDYEKIKGVGAIYSVRVYSTYSDNGGYRMPSLDKSDLTSDERNTLVVEMYPDFVKSMKENVMQYGRTINSLETGELLILRITLTKCDGCSMPKKIQLSVKQSVLKDFNSGKLNLQAAIGQIKLSTLK